MDQPEVLEWNELTARAAINARCALAFLHDVRGSMQALFSAIELLGRAAQGAPGNADRVFKASELAKRAIANHERTILCAWEILTLHDAVPVPVEVGALLQDVGHFLRNEAATRQVSVTFDVPAPIHILAEAGKLKTLLVGLATAAIDCTPAASELSIRAASVDGWAVIRIDSELGLVDSAELHALRERPLPLLNAKDLTLSFAMSYLKARGARLDFLQSESNRGLLQISYPIMAAGWSLAAKRESATEK